MPERRYYRIVLWSLVLFVLVVATPGWYIQKQLAQKMHHLEERVAALEEEVGELKSQPAGAGSGDMPTINEDHVERDPAEGSGD